MKQVKALTIHDVIRQAKEYHDAEVAKIAAMTPEQKQAYEQEQQKKALEVEEILKQLRGKPGFMEIR